MKRIYLVFTKIIITEPFLVFNSEIVESYVVLRCLSIWTFLGSFLVTQKGDNYWVNQMRLILSLVLEQLYLFIFGIRLIAKLLINLVIV